MGSWEIAQAYGLAMDDRTAKWYAESQRPLDLTRTSEDATLIGDNQLSPNMQRAAMTNNAEASLANKLGIDLAQVSRIRLITATILKKLDKAVLSARKERKKSLATSSDLGKQGHSNVVQIEFSTQGSEVEDQAILELMPTMLVNAQLLPSNESAKKVGTYDINRLHVYRAKQAPMESPISSLEKAQNNPEADPDEDQRVTGSSTIDKLSKRIGLHRASFSKKNGNSLEHAADPESLWILCYDDQ